MADSYVVVDQVPIVQVLGPNNVIDAERVEFVTKPSGVYAQREVPIQAWNAQGADAWIAPLAEAIEGMISSGLASDASFVQDVVDGTNLLRDFIEFVVTYDPGDGRPIMAALARVPAAALTVDTGFGGVLATYFGGSSTALDPQQAVRDVYDNLVATANL
jgi:hypothetical protein